MLEYRYVICHSELFGDLCSDEILITKLKGINLLTGIIGINRFFELSIDLLNSDNRSASLHYNLLKCKTIERLNLNPKQCKYLTDGSMFSPQTLLILLKWLLAYGDSNTIIEESVKTETIDELIDMCFIISDKLPKDEVENFKTEFMFANLFLNSESNIKHHISRWKVIFDELDDDKELDYISDFKRYFGYSVDEYLAVHFYFLRYNNYDIVKGGIFSDEQGKRLKSFDAKKIKDVYEKIVDNSSRNLEELKLSALNTINEPWNFEMFYLNPIIKIHEDLVVSVANRFIGYHFFSGLYWKLRHLYRTDDIRFLRAFGRPFENYIQKITNYAVNQGKNSYIFQKEFSYKFSKGDRKSSDSYIRINDNLIVVEAKAKSIDSRALKGYDIEIIREEAKELIVRPCYQGNLRLNELKSDNCKFEESEIRDFFKGIRKIFILSVSIEKVQPVKYLNKYCEDLLIFGKGKIEYNRKKINPKLTDERIVGYANLNIEEYEVLCGLIEKEIDVFSLLEKYYNLKDDNMNAYPFYNFLSFSGLEINSGSFIEKKFDTTISEFINRIFSGQN